jgi:hypothetical protein
MEFHHISWKKEVCVAPNGMLFVLVASGAMSDCCVPHWLIGLSDELHSNETDVN